MDDAHRKKVVLLGLRRSGKTSIQRVVFHGLQPKETLYLDNNVRTSVENIDAFGGLQLWDTPGQVDIERVDVDLAEVSTIVFVIDAQDEYSRALTLLHHTVVKVYEANPAVHFEVFVHKVDGLSDEYKLDTLRDIQTRILDELSDASLDTAIHISYHLTSIYDHSIFEALSKVTQKLIRQLPTLENLLNVLCANSGISKAFLFDVRSRLYIATDSSPVDTATYEVCSDALDVFIRFSQLYRASPLPSSSPPSSSPPSSDHDPASDPHTQNGHAPLSSSSFSSVPAPQASRYASGAVRLAHDTTIARWQIYGDFMLIALLRSETWDKYKGSIDYNITFFREALQQVVELEQAARRKRRAARASSGSTGGGS